MSKDYVGQFVFVERQLSPCYCGYQDGEYLILEQTGHNLYGIKPVAAYDGCQLVALPVIGQQQFKVISAISEPERLPELVEGFERFIESGKLPNRKWAEEVYERAKERLAQIRRLIKPQEDPGCNCIVLSPSCACAVLHLAVTIHIPGTVRWQVEWST